MNETASNRTKKVTSDSIFRVVSVSKNFATLSALVVENESKLQTAFPELTIDTPVRLVLPEFGLPEKDWLSGGRDITLLMLASHTSGLPRESYLTPFNMVTGSGKADAPTIGGLWASSTSAQLLESTRKTNLMFAPGQRAGYSNAGIAILASAVVSYYNNLHGSNLTWTQFAVQEILAPLNLTHSFFGTIPLELIPYIGIPGGPNFVDLIVGLGYDPAVGMWSSANDLTKYLHHIWLCPEPLPLITSAQRRRILRPTISLPDGKQQAGPGWEIDLITISSSSDVSTSLQSKTYASYGKSGDGGGFHAWIDVIPNLGYGIVVLSQHSGLPEYARIVPTSVRNSIHEFLIPAFAEVLTERMKDRFAGSYTDGRDGGAIPEETEGAGSNKTSYGRLEVKDQILYLRELTINGTSALEGLDRLGWEGNDGPRLWSTPEGVALTPAEGAGENEEFGPGAQVWRMILPGLEVCDWFDFDGYTDQNGWPLSKVVLIEGKGSAELHYPPYDIVLSRNIN
ncbi:beta-lactamase/transpeptidase-like protein [Lindgomyces ingoldianus]|uniref:Beta-lactamase/transpeptidase-like protein n=1 Tax=Lindgomyces ingoldianus TaxID=673940 RepID=A0ACB6QBT6_9PLEO|nr:beta-lactamase/transpeptidase-like protein [Lindgomyces ingoldianus]KAF2464394.1 beta-lactamase/transpeptidase-like protein [Lindgomyces ingoldianus]